MFDFGELDSAEPQESGEAKAAEDDEEAEELRRLEELRLEEEAARKRREEAEAAARRRREEREREEQRRKLQEEEEARKRKEAEAEAERRRQEQEAEEQRQKAEALRRREEEEAKAKQSQEEGQRGAAASAGEKFDELEKRLEEEERQARGGGGGGSSASTATAAAPSTPGEAFKAGDVVEIQIYVGKWVACSISGPGSKPNTYCIHILPTELYDKAAGRSDQDVADVPAEHLRKAAQPGVAGPAADGASAPPGNADPAATALAAASPDAAPAAAADADAAANAAATNGAATNGAAADGAVANGAAAGGAEGAAANGAGGAEGGAAAEGAARGEEKKAEDEAKAEDDAGFEVGVRVAIKGLTDKHEHLNGVTATLVEKKWKGNWIVDLDDEEGKKRRLRRRWLLNINNLQVSDKKGVQKYFKELGRPKQQYFVVGTWNEFVPRRMTWDHDRLCWTFEARMGHNGVECFQIWLERDKKKSVHPDTANAGNYVPWELEGPDEKGENKNWSIGSGKEGERFELRLFLWEDESPQAVEWGSLQASANKKSDDGTGAAKDSAAKKCPRKHDLKVFKPPVDGYSCSKCNKTFPKGTSFYSCRPCDYDECETCANAKADEASSSPTAKAKAASGNSRGVAEDARKFLDQAKKSDDGKAAGDNKEALKVGDRVTITSNGPYRGKHGTVMKVDEDGDPAVRLETGDAKLFYRADVAKAPPESAKPQAQVAPSNGFAFSGSKGLGKGKGVPMGYPRTPGVLGFGAS